MRDYKSLTHTRWDCKYHIVFIPKKRRKWIYGLLRKKLKEVLHELARRRNCEIVEGYLMRDHIYMCVSIPPKYSVFSTVGYLKVKRAIAVARYFEGKQKNFTGEHFWARGYFVSTVGLDEAVVREYIRNKRLTMHIETNWNWVMRQGRNKSPLRASPNRPPAMPEVI